jgi:hypothetical protein
METLAFQLLFTMQRKNTGVVSVSMEILRLLSNEKSVTYYRWLSDKHVTIFIHTHA